LSRTVIPRIVAKCVRLDYHFEGNCSFEWLIRNLNTSKAIFSKCEYGLVYNLNNLAFASMTTSTNSTMKTSWHYTNLIKVCPTSNMDKTLPNLMGSFFQPWGHTSQKVQHLLIIWGRLKSVFLCRPWQDAKHPKWALFGASFKPDSATL